MAAVAAGVAEIRTGALEKLVLARDIVATLPTGVNAARGAARSCPPGTANAGPTAWTGWWAPRRRC